ncbi:succinate dehydrogenase, hydrophobic membrane anchor protein [Acetobacter indonesiensis]|jgi:succinate dehydrogenase / fumarate reductase membrane anchor subunit|uniref:Succinate dehydrogenase hydrophobic membrane anchor subunit n=1 Tax=Acetobacter indonesiensis TaxID=104101 RepID=A0A252AU45_9PROT|nr:succinate dehydrogenase, hydrophobic membrane anchor protein [Acetobacter indonesiensis]MCG0994915.1 succinate dehydrogenase, hydrophobic membrane anchor protein [Acetobacter indonesiensis]MCI1437461.1 succinate dehydrogenase, hydrophobic membrane anchor protein [Acetobacter indonesiensis]MCI1545899.1 succinate dehydrogenase, hydrophobic membrane anchor protein [Acetobacter indonesiensis]MCI1765086.1 succinate dehydrogenase, hydrophobic membrane anchor protein [Acetobacter indonesiensis]MCP
MNASPSHIEVMRSQLGRARGLGAGGSGVGHWWAERVSAATLLPLSTWFIVQMFRLGGADHAEVVKWGGKPVNATMLAALIITTFYHAQMGLQVIVDDYVHGKAHLPARILVKIGTSLIGLLGVFAIIKLVAAGNSQKS